MEHEVQLSQYNLEQAQRWNTEQFVGSRRVDESLLRAAACRVKIDHGLIILLAIKHMKGGLVAKTRGISGRRALSGGSE